METYLEKLSRKYTIVPIFVSLISLSVILSSCSGGHRGSENESDTTTSLYKAFEPYFMMGVAINHHTMTDSLIQPVILKHFNSITAENSMKWEKIHPLPGVYDFAPVDSFVDFGTKNNMYIIGHVLVWHSQTPNWVFQDASGKPASKDTLLKRMEDHIKTVVGRYKGRVDCWDVVNEAVDDNGEERKNIWYNIAGIEYVQKAFEYVHEADPGAILIYNDYSLPSPVKREAVVKLISNLKSKGVKIDVIGMQGHYHLDYPFLNELEESIIAFSNLGCKVHFTELDINILPKFEDYHGADISLERMYSAEFNPWPESLPDSMQMVLADRYSAFFNIFIRHADVIDRVTIWGVEDGGSWLNYWPIKGRSNYPLLFDREFKPKPAFWALVKLAEEKSEVIE